MSDVKEQVGGLSVLDWVVVVGALVCAGLLLTSLYRQNRKKPGSGE